MSRLARTGTLGGLTEALGVSLPQTMAASLPLTGAVIDSRQAQTGTVFIALAPLDGVGRDHLADAFARGAVAALVPADSVLPKDLERPLIAVPDLVSRLGEVADAVYGEVLPRELSIGVTGTNGKTSVAFLLAEALAQLGQDPCYIGTLGTGRPNALDPTTHTTPDLMSLRRALVAAPFTAAAIEVSSHALAQDRIAGVTLDVAVFTNLSHEHLDYHGDMASYLAAKLKLFAHPGLRCACINADDPVAEQCFAAVPEGVQRWAFTRGAKAVPAATHVVRVTDLAVTLDRGTCLSVVVDRGMPVTIESPLLGDFHVDNLLAAFTGLLAGGVSAQAAARALAVAAPVPGRMERVPAGPGQPTVFVDYAHTPAAIERLLASVRALTDARITLVCGCGGDRDPSKREPMGRAAAAADRVVITSDNPRSEDPAAIADAMCAGLEGHPALTVELDRGAAIRHAIAQAAPDDVVLIAGKGHEASQEVDGVKTPFDDRVEAARILLPEVVVA